jgi:eukaryotic-like serine/threonine-protein kinase
MPSKNPIIGSRIQNYEIEGLIAKGGMAQVYRARDIDLDRTVAIKIIGIDTKREPIFAQRLEREARTVAQLRHPHIVGIYHKGVFDDMTYLVIEYVNGPTLSQIMKAVFDRGGRMDYNAVLTITGSVVSALDYAHNLGVIHRDIKPSNIMADRNGTVYLTDFGLALRMVDGTEGKAFGSPYYIAPEQINSSADASPRSDLYSLGVVTYRMLTGRLPFEAKKPMHVVMMHLSELPAPPSELNPALSTAVDHVLLKVLAKDPAERYSQGTDFQIALAKALGMPEMGLPVFQPRFLASTWTRINEVEEDQTFASATHLLEDVPFFAPEPEADEGTQAHKYP